MHLFADERGVMYPCCRSVGSMLPNIADDGHVLHIGDEGGIEAAWNSGYMKAIRRDMLAGARPKPCERCYLYEDLGIRSHRQSQNAQHAADIDTFIASTAPDGHAPLDLQSIDLRIGNLCNLRCRMCSPQSSKALIQEWADLHGVKSDHQAFDELRRLDWFSTESFWRMFEKHTGSVERLHFAGGEPLLIPEMFNFLDRLVGLGRAGEVMLSYNTNLTLLPPRIYELWPRFRQVRVTASIDGFGDVNSFIRYPSHWNIIDANLKTLDADADLLNCGGGIGMNTTVQLYNIFRLDELLEYAATSFHRFEAPNLSVLTIPEHYSIRLLPPSMKEAAAARLRRFVDRFDGWPDRWRGRQLDELLASIDGILQHMMEADGSAALPEFRRWNDHQDRFRGQSTAAVLPELAPLFAEATP
jgi:hypothetical protein